MSTSSASRGETAISPEQYREMLEGLRLENINLAEYHAEIDHNILRGEASQMTPIRLGMEQGVVRWEQKDDTLTFWHSYQLRGRVKRKQVLRIGAVYLVRYTTKQPVSADFAHIFQQSTLILTTYPYFRELVDSTMRRMGVPPVTLPMVLVQ
ncbi:hypothetical protein HRbin16_02526 [bacterium HR16]|nr:hypothetical protein HRbin16_02526 [bacterium HR16]